MENPNYQDDNASDGGLTPEEQQFQRKVVSERTELWGSRYDTSNLSTDEYINLKREEYEIKDPFLNKEKFKNRRRMAWLSFLMMVIMIGLVFFKLDPQYVQNYDGVLAWGFGTFASVILGYMGFTSFPNFFRQ